MREVLHEGSSALHSEYKLSLYPVTMGSCQGSFRSSVDVTSLMSQYSASNPVIRGQPLSTELNPTASLMKMQNNEFYYHS
jgi:hypothetical protein